MKKTYTGINIQWPISRDILVGSKTIETRTYPIPEKYLNTEMALIETPGKAGRFKARIIAIIVFTKCIKYKNANEFYQDLKKHNVGKNSEWAWKDKSKWGWTVEVKRKIDPPIEIGKRKGIVYTTGIRID